MLNDLEVRARQAPPMVVLDLHGDVTAAAQEPLMEAYIQAANQDVRTILLNFEAVDYLNSGGIAAVIALISRARQSDQRLFLTGLTPHYQLIFDIMGLTTYAPLFESEDAARASLES
ncbi:MAG TPA: STAS domain-containing protein [Chloroflexota bacterium]|jgi:anti-anti-sigma factor